MRISRTVSSDTPSSARKNRIYTLKTYASSPEMKKKNGRYTGGGVYKHSAGNVVDVIPSERR